MGPSPTLGLDELIDDLEAAAVDNKISEITKAQSELEQQRKQLEDASKMHQIILLNLLKMIPQIKNFKKD